MKSSFLKMKMYGILYNYLYFGDCFCQNKLFSVGCVGFFLFIQFNMTNPCDHLLQLKQNGKFNVLLVTGQLKPTVKLWNWNCGFSRAH